MRLEEVGKLYPEIKNVLRKLEIKELYPPQEEAIKNGFGACKHIF